jgi:(1->4)-alpha-D-glucan 1-alpha-D-glucosylmutase
VPPTATYRLQLSRELTFHDAAAVVPYLAALGVSHVYCSPVLQAVPGSAHGYDVVDHRRLSDDLGGDAGWAALVAATREHHLGLVVDVVPNHMAVPVPERLNAALWDVLAKGAASAYASWFDVDWEAGDGRWLLPVLGDDLDACLARGEVAVADGAVRYFDHELPLAPGTDTLADDLPALLQAQHYRLAHWREGAERLNYRRFFDVTSLVGLRVEEPAVFTATHERLLRLVADGEVDGLRIDHPDGLADPAGYLEALSDATGPVWTVVEKILEHGETLPASWRCAGTTGYDAIVAITHLLTDPAGEKPLTDVWVELGGGEPAFPTVVGQSKRFVVESMFRPEVARLVRELRPLADRDPHATAFTDDALRHAVTGLLVAFDVYRAYAGDSASARRLDAAAERATRTTPEVAAELAWLAGLLHRRRPDDAAAEAFAVRFEQTTGPVMAKGVEDTAFYRYHRLVAHNEVGGDPGGFGMTVAAWHEHCARLAADRPAAMTTLSTHDTKRSEDVRARLLVLAEVPDEWLAAVTRWRAAARQYGPPDPATDYLFWQTLVGTLSPVEGPIDAARLQRYLEKAVREAKQRTSWTDPDEEFERRLHAYAAAVLADGKLVRDVAGWVEEVVRGPGQVNGLSQKLLQLTMPGIPDVYQGQELVDLSLVDPDNRRPVDYAARRAALAALDEGRADAPSKLRVTATTLRLRRDRPELFAGGYAPVAVRGPAAEHAVAFRRGAGGDGALAVVTRLPVGLAERGGWEDTTVELSEAMHDALTGRPAAARLADLLHDLPVALLVPGAG